jgi:hypothetical protein
LLSETETAKKEGLYAKWHPGAFTGCHFFIMRGFKHYEQRNIETSSGRIADGGCGDPGWSR